MKKRLMAKILSALMIESLFTANGGIQPVVAKAAVTVEASTTYSATVNGIVWNYEVDTVGNAINVGPKDRYNLKQFWGDNVKVVIPEALEGKKVTSIRDHAFFECGKVISITIPQGVTKIGNYAFASCLSLKNITIPSGVTSIENNTFKAGTYDYCNGTITKMQDFSINSFTSSIIDNLKVGTSVVLQGNATSNASTIQYKMSVINPKNETTIIKDYSTSNVSTWTPSEVGDYTLVLDVKDSNGKTLRTEMKLSTYSASSHITTIYYKGYSTPYIHYKVGAGSWTQVPGIAMKATTDKPGYTHKMTINLGDADTLTACFNNGSGNWDSRNGANYTFKVGVYTYSNGSSILIN